jgi:hypothetical protein
METQSQPKRRIEYIIDLLHQFYKADFVGISLDADKFTFDGKFTTSELRLFAAIRDVLNDDNSALNKRE